MKKIIKLLFLLFLFSIIKINASTVDTVGPVINSYSFNKKEYSVGEDIKLSLDIIDEVSGSNMVIFEFVDEEKYLENSTYSILSISYSNLKDGSYDYSSNLSLGIKNGTYKLYYVRVYDKNNNVRYYKTSDIKYEFGTGNELIDGCSITISGYDESKYVKMINFNISNQNPKINEEVIIRTEVDNPDEVSYIDVGLSKYAYYFTLRLEREENTNFYSTTFKPTLTGTYQFTHMNIHAKNGLITSYKYTNGGGGTLDLNYNNIEIGTYDIIIDGEEVKPNVPILEKVSEINNTYYAPSILNIYLKVISNNEPSSIDLIYDEYNENYSFEDYMKPATMLSTMKCIKGNYGEYNFKCSLDIDQYFKQTKYVILEIWIHDNFGNFNEYRIKTDDLPIQTTNFSTKTSSLNEIIFNVIPNSEDKYVTSTTAINALDKINSAPDNATISVDSTNSSIVKKEFFDAIKGTNKTLSIETNGIMWIINGKDIIYETKDIDVSSNVQSLGELSDNELFNKIFDKALIINFAKNGLLPGKFKIRVKPSYTFRKYLGEKEKLNIYYYDENNSKTRESIFDIIASNSRLINNDYYEFYLIHNSKYILSNSEISTKYIMNNYSESLGNNELNQENGIITTPKISISKGNNNSLVLKFNEQENVEKYYIYRSTDKKKYTKIATVNTNQYTDKSLTYGKTYYYKIKANNDYNGTTGYSNIVYKKVVPNKVVNLKVSSIKKDSVKLSYDKVSTTGYEIYRSTDNKKWSKITTISKNSTLTYTNKKLKANKTYYYKVRAYKTVSGKKVYGSYSSVLKVKTAPDKGKLSVSLKDYNALNINVNSIKGASKYKLYRSNDNKNFTLLKEVSSGTYIDSEVELGKTYYYKVKACNSNNTCGSYSSVSKLKVTPKKPSISLSTASKKVTIKTKLITTDGYEVYRSTSKKGKYTKVGEINKETLLLENITKKRKTYYYKIRSYIIKDGKKIYSSYSSIKSIKSK